MPATQIYRPFRLKTPLGDDALLLESFTGVERISTPYRFVLRVLSPDPNVDLGGLLTKPAVLTMHLEEDSETVRHVHGNINRIKLLETGDDNMAAYEMEMVPWLWFMRQFFDSRIFQHKTVPQILEKVFADRGLTNYRLSLQGSYPQREYCVQYRETDFNFVSRLMEEEGIFYFFEQSESSHTMVLADMPSAIVPCPNKPTARYQPATGGVLEKETVASIEHEFEVRTKKASLNDYDFEKPKTSLYASLDGSVTGQVGEFYDYPGKYKTKAEGDRYARIRLEEREAAVVTVRGHSTCIGFECGFKFELVEHFRESANQNYLLIGIDHRGRNTSYRSGSTEPYDYRNSFECIPAPVPFRPPRLAQKPVVHGNQVALVVGKAGEEIWTDKFGRVIVQFYWDREGNRDEKSSCWIRVAHGWAGKQWGIIHIPRIGQEVLVSFLEGDPDRPLITGSVYNGDQTVPYTLPDEQTKSTTKSMSSKGGGGFNEFRFEDKKGSEQIFLHAEKDLHERVKNNTYRNVIGFTHETIKKDRLQKIETDDHMQIVGDQNTKIDGTVSLNVGMDFQHKVKMKHAVDAGQEIHLKAGMNVMIESGTSMTLKVGGNFINLSPAGIAIKGTMVLINSGGAAGSGAGCSPTAPTAPEDACEADPGAVTTVAPPQPVPPASVALEHIGPAAASLLSAAETGAPFCDI